MTENDFVNMIIEVIKNNENSIPDKRTIPLLKLLVDNGSAVSELYDELMEDCPF